MVFYYNKKWPCTSLLRWGNGSTVGQTCNPTQFKLNDEPLKIVIRPMTLHCLGISFMLWLSPESSCTGPCGKTCETVKWSHADINVEKLVKQWNEAIQTLTFPQKVGILVHVGKTGQTVKWSHADINVGKLVKQWNETNISPESRSTGPWGKNWSNSEIKPCRH